MEGERKQVTVLFADIKGSMELLADRDPEAAHGLLDPVLERMMEAVHRYEGTVNQVMGDGIMALFGAPVAHEDHAVRACYAALHMQESLRQYAEHLLASEGMTVQIRRRPQLREVVVGAIGSDLRVEYTAVGQTTHLAARMEQLAFPGSTLITAATLELAEGYVAVKARGRTPIKGMSQPVEVYELTGVGSARSRIQVSAARGLTKFVGRARELLQMFTALDRVQSGHGELVALVGEAGLGKSRLVREFVHSHRTQGFLILQSSSVSSGKASAWNPVIDLLKAYFGIGERDDARAIRERIAGKMLMLDRQLEASISPLLYLLDAPLDDQSWERLEPAERRVRILEACKRLLLREAQVQPIVLVFEDLHWIDHETQALLDGLVESLSGARIVLLVNTGRRIGTAGATRASTRRFVSIRSRPRAPKSWRRALLGNEPALEAVGRLLLQRTGGNPFFFEESVRSLVETGVLQGARGAYRLSQRDRRGRGAGYRARNPRSAHRSFAGGAEAAAADCRGHRHGCAVRVAAGNRRPACRRAAHCAE